MTSKFIVEIQCEDTSEWFGVAPARDREHALRLLAQGFFKMCSGEKLTGRFRIRRVT